MSSLRFRTSALGSGLLLALALGGSWSLVGEANARPSLADLQSQVTELEADVAALTPLRTIMVSPVGPTAAANCTELLAALASITDNSPTNPYLVRIEPGIYDCGQNGHVVMKPHVDLEGSGEAVTIIRGEGRTFPGIPAPGGGTFDNALLVGASNSQLRFLTLELTAGFQAFTTAGAVSFSMLNVTVRSAVAGTGIVAAAGDFTNVTVDIAGCSANALLVSGVSLNNVTSTARLVGTACGTVQAMAMSGTVRARNSSFSAIGGGRALFVDGVLNLAATQVVGSIVLSGGGFGDLNCIAVYNANFAPLVCP